MKMAKADARDIDAAGDLMALLDNIDRGYYPADDDKDGDTPTWFDEDDPDHLRAFYDKTKAILDRAPGFQGRIIGGMCYVIMYGKNEIIDPAADVLELHPRLRDALRDAERYRHLRGKVCGIASKGFDFVNLPPMPGNWAHGAIAQHFDAAIDGVIAAEQGKEGA